MLRDVLHGPELLGLVIAVLVGLPGSTLVQAWAARALGDPRPVQAGFGRLGRLQLDPLGTVCTVLTIGAWGWMAPVPVDIRFRKQRPRAIAALLLGPIYLFGVAVAAGAVFAHADLGGFVSRVSAAALVCSCGLVVISLAPFPPLPLGHALWMYVPTTPGWTRARYLFEEESIGSLVAFAIVMLPLVFSPFPDLVAHLVPHLENGVFDLVGRPS